MNNPFRTAADMPPEEPPVHEMNENEMFAHNFKWGFIALMSIVISCAVCVNGAHAYNSWTVLQAVREQTSESGRRAAEAHEREHRAAADRAMFEAQKCK